MSALLFAIFGREKKRANAPATPWVVVERVQAHRESFDDQRTTTTATTTYATYAITAWLIDKLKKT